jgi:hypothetical protein
MWWCLIKHKNFSFPTLGALTWDISTHRPHISFCSKNGSHTRMFFRNVSHLPQYARSHHKRRQFSIIILRTIRLEAMFVRHWTQQWHTKVPRITAHRKKIVWRKDFELLCNENGEEQHQKWRHTRGLRDFNFSAISLQQKMIVC